jgi:serine/threonine-protein kinase PpkA
MTTVLIVEDHEAIRTQVTRLLELGGYQIVQAGNGAQGLERARQLRPDLVISALNTPEMDGFELLDGIRADPHLATTPVMLLTALHDRASMRRGMTAGADDYLPKPFTPDELLEAVQGLLKRRGRIEARIESAVKLRGAKAVMAESVIDATVLFSDIRNFTALAEKLSSTEVAELLTRYFERTCEPVLENGGGHLKFTGDGLMSVFADPVSGGSPLPAARRAVCAALGMALATHEFRAWLDLRFARRGLPPFAIGVGLHAGEVTLCPLGTVHHKEITPIGDTVNVAARLEAASKELGWTVVASSSVLRRGGDGIQTGGRTSLDLRGKNACVDVAEVTGIVTNLEDQRHGLAALTVGSAEVRDAVQINSQIAARATKGS